VGGTGYSAVEFGGIHDTRKSVELLNRGYIAVAKDPVQY
jgi:hypothetical protein